MTERRDNHAIHARGIENRCTCRDADELAVERDLNHSGRCHDGVHVTDECPRAVLRQHVLQM